MTLSSFRSVIAVPASRGCEGNLARPWPELPPLLKQQQQFDSILGSPLSENNFHFKNGG